MQTKHKKGQAWTKDEKDFALLSYYKSPSAYNYWRNALKIKLPAVSTIRNWLSELDCLPGFNLPVIQEIERKVQSMSDSEKVCSLLFDEIKIKKCIEYSTKYDKIEGFHDHGDSRKNQFGTQILLFLIRGVHSNWKLPFAYFVSGNTIKNIDLKKLILEGIQYLLNAGLNVVSVICDQGKNNQSALKMLGVTKENPFFFVNSSKVYSIYDAPHLIKNFRNNFLNNNYLFNNKIVSFSDVVKTYQIDLTSSTGRSLMKITEAHINPDNFQKMSCSLATQIFSLSMASAVRTAFQTGELLSKTALDTADFLEFVNNLFDILNSKELYSKNPYACALSPERPLVRETMENAISKLLVFEKIVGPNKYTRPDCFDGMIQSLRAILALHDDLLKTGQPILYTSRLNQDPIENKFACFRQRGGYNPNPTVRTFRTTLRISLKVNLLKPVTSSNCSTDDDIDVIFENRVLKTTDPVHVHTSQQVNEEEEICSIASTLSRSTSSSSIKDCKSIAKITLQDCANTYFAGYLAKKTLDKYGCENCKKCLINNSNLVLSDKRELLILNRTYKNVSVGLRKPTEVLSKFVKKSLLIIKKVLDKYPHKNDILKSIQHKILQKSYYKRLFTTDDICEDHIKYLINLMIRCKIYKECKWRTSFCKKAIPKKRKFDILQGL